MLKETHKIVGGMSLSVLDTQLEVIAAGDSFLGSSHFDLVTEKSDIIEVEVTALA